MEEKKEAEVRKRPTLNSLSVHLNLKGLLEFKPIYKYSRSWLDPDKVEFPGDFTVHQK